jgi:hypothetical protein
VWNAAASEGVAIVAAASSVSVEIIRARSESKCCVPFRSPPTTKAIPSTRMLLARIEPTSAACTTPMSPLRRAKIAMNSSGRLPSAD